MNNDEYQERGQKLWLTAERWEKSVQHALMGLQTETAEVTDYYKKMCFTPDRFEGKFPEGYIREELGDILYYIARLADDHNLTLSEIMHFNIVKLEERYPRD